MPLTNQLNMNANQGLMGYAPPQLGLMSAGMQQPHPMSPMGPWSQMAYQMAGSPRQGGGYAGVPVPPTPAGSGGTTSGPGTTSSILTGLLGALAQNPSIIKNLGSSLSSLLGGASSATSAAVPAAAGTAGQAFAPAGSTVTANAGGTSTLFGDTGATSAATPGTTTFFGDGASAAGTGTAAGSGGASSGLLGSGALAGGAGSLGASGAALGAGAPGVFASGSAAAGSGTGAGVGATGALGVLGPMAIAGALFGGGLMAGDSWANGKQQGQGNDLMKNWMNSSGAQYVPVPGQHINTNGAGGAFGGLSSAQTKNQWVDKSGNPLSDAQVHSLLVQYAQANGLPTGDIHV